MSASILRLFFFILFACLSSLTPCGSVAALPLCPRSDLAGVADALRSECPIWIERSLPEEIHGDTLDKRLAGVEDGAYVSVLFYASWCPFSRNFKPTFDALSSMFPQFFHLTVEESSTMPRYNKDDRVFSRYGIHSFPSILLANRTIRIRYHGSKDLVSLAHFYTKATGQDPVTYFHADQTKEATEASLRDEPYLALSLLFVIWRAFACFFPELFSKLESFWAVYGLRRVNFGALSELKRMWNKLRNKTGNLHKGAESARVWASSFASVSLGKPSSSRLARSD